MAAKRPRRSVRAAALRFVEQLDSRTLLTDPYATSWWIAYPFDSGVPEGTSCDVAVSGTTADSGE
jgi:hypothetical protein